MSLVSTLSHALREANQVQSTELSKIRSVASKGFIAYLWIMTVVVSVLAFGWSDHWAAVAVGQLIPTVIATVFWRRASNTASTRLVIVTAMSLSWSLLIYSSSGYGSGEFILDAHMVFFCQIAMLMAYFCWRSLLLTAGIAAVHHFLFSGLAPLLVWPSAQYSWFHLTNHVVFVLMTAIPAMIVAVAVSRLFGRSESMVNDLQDQMEKMEKLEQERQLALATEEKRAAEQEEVERISREREEKKEAEIRQKEEAREKEKRKLELEHQEEIKRNAAEQDHVVTAVASGLRALAQGDLRQTLDEQFPAHYESLRHDYNEAVTSLRAILDKLLIASDGMKGTISEITAASDDLAKRTEENAETLGETSSALADLTNAIQTSADSATLAYETVTKASDNAVNAKTVVGQTVAAMSKINDSSSKITKIIDVIEDIAFQTNLLALNAGVEAARAGEAGRGFAVVASEVRDLAQRSSDAAHEIKTLISSSETHVEDGVNLVGQTGEALEAIVTDVTTIAQQVTEIVDTVQTQSSGASEINKALSNLDASTQKNTAMFEETTAASHALDAEAGALAEIVASFKTDDLQDEIPAVGAA